MNKFEYNVIDKNDFWLDSYDEYDYLETLCAMYTPDGNELEYDIFDSDGDHQVNKAYGRFKDYIDRGIPL
jgi:hypothetical protein